MRPLRYAALLVAALGLTPAASAGGPPATHLPQGQLLFTFKPTRSQSNVVARFLAVGKVHDWVGRYPKSSLITQGTFDKPTHLWTVQVWSGPAGEIATGKVDDRTGTITQAW